MIQHLTLDHLLVTDPDAGGADLSYLFAEESGIVFVLSKGLHGQLSSRVRNQDIIYEAPERVLSNGELIYALDQEALFVQLVAAKELGCQRLVVLLMHADQHALHESIVAALAQPLEFSAVLLSQHLPPELLQPWQQVEQNHKVRLDLYHQHAQSIDQHWYFLQPTRMNLSSTKSLVFACYLLRQNEALSELTSNSLVNVEAGDLLLVQTARTK